MPYFEQITASDGLSQGMIFDLIQDKKGFLWFATNDGLNRYDGYGFKVYQNDPFNAFSISRNEIQSLLEDHAGRLWVGTVSNGISIRDPKTDRFFHLNNMASQSIRCFAETPDGSVWVGTEKGVYRVRLPEVWPSGSADLRAVARVDTFFWDGPMTDQRPIPNFIHDLAVDKDGKLWVSTNMQISCFDPVQMQLHKLWTDPAALSNDHSILPIHLSVGPDGSMWVSHPDRLLHVRGERVDMFPFPTRSPFPQTDVVFDAAGNLFTSTRKQIFTLSAAQQQAGTGAFSLLYQFSDDGIIGSTQLLMDNGGLLWIGTNGFGLRKYNPGDHRLHHYIPNRSLRRILPDRFNRVWIWYYGTFHRLDEKENKFADALQSGPGLLQHDLLERRNGEFWLLCENTASNKQGEGLLIKINPQTFQQEAQYPIPGRVTILSHMKEDRSGKIYISGNEGKLIVFDPQNILFETADLNAVTGYRERILSMQEDVSGHAWIGTTHGLIKSTPGQKGRTFSLYKNDSKDRSSLNCDVILATIDDPKQPDRFLWVGTKGGGLNHLDKMTGKCTHFTTADGLPNNVVYGILPDGTGALWLSTNFGISKFDPDTRGFQNFFASDGLQENEFNTSSYASAPDGRLFFGGVNGLTAFYPQELNESREAPKVYLTALKIQNHALQPGDGIIEHCIEETQELTLAHFQNQLTFEFAAMEFAAPQQNQYRYRLRGADKDWVEPTTANAATYANLAPGDYVFELSSGGSHGVWNGREISLSIHILPPWWRSTWAYFLYFLTISGALWGIYRFQINKLKLKNKLAYEQREAGRLAELDRLKTNFFSSVTHEFRTPLTLLLEPARQLLAEAKDRTARYRLELIEKNARRLLQFVNQLMDLSKLEAGQMPLEIRPDAPLESLRMIVESFQPLAIKNQIKLHVIHPDKSHIVLFDRGKFEQVVSNLLSNALKFTGSNGTVTVELEMSLEDRIQLNVTDTGIGIPENALALVFDRFYQTGAFSSQGTGIGLALTKELVERMSGSISVKSQPEIGTTFSVVIPAKLANVGAVPASINKPLAEPSPQLQEFSDPEELPVSALVHSDKHPLLLLIEDDSELRRFIRASLPAQYRIAEAANGAEGIQMALELVPDLIISDLMMPEKNGFEVCSALKNDPRSSHIPIILLTAKSTLKSKIEGLQTGADVYLTKPFRADELVAHIENLLLSRRQLQEYFKKTSQTRPVKQSAVELFNLDENEFLQQVIKVVEDNLESENVSAETFARSLFMSRSQLHRKISALTGLPLTEFVRNYRLDRAREMLARKEGNISEIAWRTGFPNAKYFSTCFRERFGQPPSWFRSGVEA